MRKLSSSRSHKFPNVASQIRVAFSKIVSNTRVRFPDELAITPNTSEAADNCFSASSRSRSKRVAFTSSLTLGKLGRDVVALSRFVVADLRRRALTVWPRALERRFIAFPKSAQGIVAGQIHPLEVGNSGFRTQLAGYLPMSALGQKRTCHRQRSYSLVFCRCEFSRSVCEWDTAHLSGCRNTPTVFFVPLVQQCRFLPCASIKITCG